MKDIRIPPEIIRAGETKTNSIYLLPEQLDKEVFYQVEELSNLIWLQTGKTYDMATIGTLDHIAAYGESFWCVELVESNITLK